MIKNETDISSPNWQSSHCKQIATIKNVFIADAMILIGANSSGDEALPLLQGVSAAALWECAGAASGGLPRRRPLRASQTRLLAPTAPPQRGAAPSAFYERPRSSRRAHYWHQHPEWWAAPALVVGAQGGPARAPVARTLRRQPLHSDQALRPGCTEAPFRLAAF